MAGSRSALVVATYRYDDTRLQMLQAPQRDADALAEVLGDPAIGGFEVQTVVNEKSHDISVALAEFFAQQGVIKDVYVKEGQQVTEGQPLLRVATDQLTGGGEDVNAATLDILTSQKEALSRQIAAEQQRTMSEQQRLAASVSNLANQVSLRT